MTITGVTEGALGTYSIVISDTRAGHANQPFVAEGLPVGEQRRRCGTAALQKRPRQTARLDQ
jgi:hypothetical protein